jgi:uncharacterized membrane protein YjjP (DUF1212 family)
MSIIKIIGIVLLVVGAVVLILGAYNLISFNSSTGGKIANKVAGVLGKQTETVKNSIIQISISVICLVAGVVLYKKG